MPDTDWNYWNLIKFNEDQHDDGSFAWLMRKHQCMHCADPGCLRACPADGAIVQYANGIVDFQQENCIGCQFCVSGCPVQHSEVQLQHQEGLQVHAVLGPSRSRSGARLHQVVSDRLPALRHQGRHEVSWPRSAPRSCAMFRASRTPACTIPRPSAAPASSTCCTTSTSRRSTATCPRIRSIPLAFTIWKECLQADRLVRRHAGLRRRGDALRLRGPAAHAAARRR